MCVCVCVCVCICIILFLCNDVSFSAILVPYVCVEYRCVNKTFYNESKLECVRLLKKFSRCPHLRVTMPPDAARNVNFDSDCPLLLV